MSREKYKFPKQPKFFFYLHVNFPKVSCYLQPIFVDRNSSQAHHIATTDYKLAYVLTYDENLKTKL